MRAMRNIATYLGTSSLLALAATHCARHSDPPATPAPPTAQVAPVTQAPGYGDGTARAQPAPSVTGAPLSTPNPLALPCTTDANCLTHRCNVAAQKCAWPCQTDNDCIPGNACIAPTCLPKLQ